MRRVLLLAVLLVVPCLAFQAEPAEAADYKTRVLGSFESDLTENSTYGQWTKAEIVTGLNASATVTRTSATQYHGTYSADLNATRTDLLSTALAYLVFSSNSSIETYWASQITFMYKLSFPVGGDGAGDYIFQQYNGSTLLDVQNVELSSAATWTLVTVTPVWHPEADRFLLWLWASNAGSIPIGTVNLVVDFVTARSDITSVRIRYWNLYTGLGYYEEKLLAKYYSFPEGWTDVWKGEFPAYLGDEVLVQVADAFGRNVWTGIVAIDSDPVYVDVLVPIVTVFIPKPDWYNDSVPMEWRITNLPWGPDGPVGLELPATGFEFEVLAGWYSISWLANHYVDAGNQTVYIDGNVSARRSYSLTNISIPINPDYEEEITGGTFDLSTVGGLIAFLAAAYEDDRVKALCLLLLGISLLGILWRGRKEAEKRLGGSKK